MSDDDVWIVTMVFREATGKKEVTERLSFGSKDAADKEIATFKGDHENKTGKIFTIQNEVGESVEFRWHDWIRHVIKRETGGIY